MVKLNFIYNEKRDMLVISKNPINIKEIEEEERIWRLTLGKEKEKWVSFIEPDKKGRTSTVRLYKVSKNFRIERKWLKNIKEATVKDEKFYRLITLKMKEGKKEFIANIQLASCEACPLWRKEMKIDEKIKEWKKMEKELDEIIKNGEKQRKYRKTDKRKNR